MEYFEIGIGASGEAFYFCVDFEGVINNFTKIKGVDVDTYIRTIDNNLFPNSIEYNRYTGIYEMKWIDDDGKFHRMDNLPSLIGNNYNTWYEHGKLIKSTRF